MVLDDTLADALARSDVRLREVDNDTIRLDAVPTHAAFFSKPRTNLLVKRPSEGLPYVICVDEDLEYTGRDPAVARAFAGGGCRRGWRVLPLPGDGRFTLHDVLEFALRIVGFGGREPAIAWAPAAAADGARRAYVTNVSALVADGRGEPCVGRRDQTGELVCSLAQQNRCFPLVVAPSGAGKTSFLHGVARAFPAFRRPSWQLTAVDLGGLFAGTLLHAERETRLADLLDDSVRSPDTVRVLEHVDLVPAEVPHGLHLLARALERGARLVGTTLPEYVRMLAAAPLARRLRVIELAPVGAGQTFDLLLAHRDRTASHHGVRIDDAILRAVAERAVSLAGPMPAAAIDLLDATAVRAALTGDTVVALHHVYLAAACFAEITG